MVFVASFFLFLRVVTVIVKKKNVKSVILSRFESFDFVLRTK